MFNKSKKKSIIIGAVLIIVLVILDQLVKVWAVNNLMGQEDIILINGVLQFHYLENIGAAFSTLSGKRLVFLILTPILILVIGYVFVRLPLNKKYNSLNYICIFLVAGAIGNYIDRVKFGYVVDMIYFSLIDFPVFNVADIYVTCSVAFLIILILFYYKESDLEDLSKSIKLR